MQSTGDATSARFAQPTTALARIVLSEALIAARDVASCAQVAVDWFAQHAGLARSFVGVVDEVERARLVGVAAHGVDPIWVNAFAIDIDDRQGPLVEIVRTSKPARVRLRIDALGLAETAWLGVPLPPDDHEPIAGVLFVAPPPKRSAEVEWGARVLGQRLVELRRVTKLAGEEERQRRERGLLERIINSLPDLILFADEEGKVIFANPRAERFFASQDDESEGRRRAVALNNMLFSAGLSRRAIEGAEAVRRELPLVDPDDGSDRLFELMSTVMTGPDGPGIVSILRNVTDLQRAAQEIEENYRKLRAAEADVRAERDRLDVIIDSVADPILVTDSDGSTVMMNEPAERLFTAPPGSTAARAKRVRANDAHVSSHVSNLFLAPLGERWRGELGLVDPETGAPLPVEAISGKILSSVREVTGVVTILHDRTEALERARLYEQLKQASEQIEQKVRDATAELVRHNELLRRQAIELEQASNLKSQFLATMSHEFRTPLNAILGYTDMLLKGVSGMPTPSQRRSLSRVDSNARHLLAIINDILDISRIEAGKMPVNVTTFRVDELLAEVLAEVAPLVDHAKLEVSSHCARSLPRVRSDRPKVKQILMNLLSNALKFTTKGSVKVTASLAPDRKALRVAVADTGIGIAKSDQEKIFDDFRQADDSPTRNYGGAGLGLAICRRLANVLGGRITLVSRVGRGSTFTLDLPLRRRNP